VVLYGEALCPYCARFTTQVVAPLLTEEGGLAGIFNFSYIAWGNAIRTVDGVVCQHGELECQLNKVISCVQDLFSSQDHWFPYIECLEKAPEDGLRRAAKCATKTKLNGTAIAECAAGDRGDELDKASEAATRKLDPPHTYVPWVVVDGIPIGANYEALRSVICAAFKGDRPDGCKQVPSDVAIKAFPFGASRWEGTPRSLPHAVS